MDKQRDQILIVDDTPENLRVLGEWLESGGHGVRVADHGAQALEIARSVKIDLILLDIMMPGMDGYAVCKKLKGSKATRAIPVIFLTALDSPEDEAKGLKLGAVDYITKPFKLELVRARVENQLALHHARQELVRHNENLETLVAERSQELAEAHRRLVNADGAKYDFLQLIYQELWAPDKGVIDRARQLSTMLDPGHPDAELWAAGFEESQRHLFDTLNNALLLAGTHLEGGKSTLHPIRWEQVLTSVLGKLGPETRSKNLTFSIEVPEPQLIAGDLDLLFQALTAVVHAAIVLADPGSSPAVRSESLPTLEVLLVSVPVQNPEPGLETLFSPETRFHPSVVGQTLGLVLPLASKILRAFGGSLSLTYPESGGLDLRVEFVHYTRSRGATIRL